MMRFAFVACAVASATACATADRAGTVDAGRDAPGVSDAPMQVDASSPSCSSSDTCQGAMMLGSISGDTGNMRLMASGYRAAWFRVRVTEDASGVGGVSLRVAARVNSPPNVGFDPLIYVNTGSDQIECSNTTGTSSGSGNIKEVKAEWGEGGVANGADDSRDISIEVRPAAMTGCNTAQMWMLEVEGNWN